MLCGKQILQVFACFVTFKVICAYPHTYLASTEVDQEIKRLKAKTDMEISLQNQETKMAENLYRYEGTLHRLRRALQELAYEEAADDMELAEINVFRPLFTYRAEYAKQVKTPRRQLG